ncbi:MAG: hypothetical protein AB7G11_03050 [Phycisphaerales bacterium]
MHEALRHTSAELLGSVVVACLLSASAAGALPPQPDPPSPSFAAREFSYDAPRGVTFSAATPPVMAGDRIVRDGLAYTWTLPEGLDQSHACDLVIVCHTVGKDSTWAPTALDLPTLGKRIVVAPDGTSAIAKGIRTFRADDTDVLAFREFILEMTQAFPVDRIFLLGVEQGGSFCLYFAGAFPGLTEGVVTIDSQVWQDTPTRGGVLQVPLALCSSTGAGPKQIISTVQTRAAYLAQDHPMLLDRPISRENPGLMATGAALALDWCRGMVTQDPRVILDTALNLLSAPSPAFGPASLMLRRLLGTSESNPANDPIDDVPDDIRRRAVAALDLIDLHAALHLLLVLRDVAEPADLVLNGRPGIGHLVAMREDFRGVPLFERFILQTRFDQAAAGQFPFVPALADACEFDESAQEFRELTSFIPYTYMLDVWPEAVLARLKQSARSITVTESTLAQLQDLTLLLRSRERGVAQYRDTLKSWRMDPR